jgi:hypothetical protein
MQKTFLVIDDWQVKQMKTNIRTPPQRPFSFLNGKVHASVEVQQRRIKLFTGKSCGMVLLKQI